MRKTTNKELQNTVAEDAEAPTPALPAVEVLRLMARAHAAGVQFTVENSTFPVVTFFDTIEDDEQSVDFGSKYFARELMNAKVLVELVEERLAAEYRRIERRRAALAKLNEEDREALGL